MMKTLGACILATTALFAAASARADDGGISCATSADCGLPTPYCHPDEHRCVACLADKNCSTTEVCDPVGNTCVTCRGDADCPPDHPYCGGAAAGCVECKTDANCGDPRLKCFDGLCGKCGDGVCGPHEQVRESEFFNPYTKSPNHLCLEDCQSECPGVAASLGKAKRVTVGTRDLVPLECTGDDAPDVLVSFTAKDAGTYYFRVTHANKEENAFFTVSDYVGGCDGPSTACYGGSIVSSGDSLTAGQVLTLVVQSSTPGDFDVLFTDTPPECEGDGCAQPPPPPPPVADGGVTEAQKALCSDNAMTRGDTICGGVTCACEHCPTTYDDCSVVPGCLAIGDCLQQKHCVGIDCYASGACRAVIDTNGGIAAAGFRTATTLQSCAVRYGCSLPCETTTQVDAGTEGGLCAPGRDVACACSDGGAGTRTCTAAGDAFSVCSCAGPSDKVESGCDCNLSAGSRPGAAAWLGLTLAVVLGRRRIRRGKRGMRP